MTSMLRSPGLDPGPHSKVEQEVPDQVRDCVSNGKVKTLRALAGSNGAVSFGGQP
jgi:hypothetical protein